MTRSLLSLAILFFILFVVQPLLIEAHSNTVAVAGSEVIMKCQTYSGNCIGVEWKKYNAPTAPQMRIFKNNEIYPDYRGRYSVDSSSGCNLLIKNVTLTDAGRVICDYTMESSTLIELSLLIVLESLPRCSVQVDASSEGIAAEGDGIQFTCELRFNAIEEASMRWKSLDNVSTSVKPGTTGRLVHSVVAKRPEIPSLECITTFDLPKNIVGLASNIPIGPSCATQPIRPLYRVTTVTLTPSLSVYSLGSTVTCSADGNPPPTYEWQIADANGMDETWTDIGTGKTFKPSMTTQYNGTVFRCVADHTIRGKSFVAFSRAFQINDIGRNSVTAYGEAETSMSCMNITAIAFFSLGVLSTLLVFGIVLFIMKRMQCVQFHRNTAQRSGADEEDKQVYVNMGNATTHSSSVAKNEGDETAYASLGEDRNAQHNYASLAEMRV